MEGILRQAQKMQENMRQVQEELGKRVVEGASGGGMVKAFVNGKGQLVKIEIEKELVKPEEVDFLEDMIVAAVRSGIEKAKNLADTEMAKLTGGLKLPGIF
ncbi:MAG: YbaB/EbfC family nucleoid-associated protein [Planctomycetota bacterium]